MNKNERLIRAYIRESLLSEDLNDYGYNPDAAALGQIRVYGDSGQLANTFIKPFTDVFKTAYGKSKETLRKARTAVGVGVKAVMQTIIPGYSADFAEMFDKEKEDIAAIRREYQDVYNANREALKGDAELMAFMLAPGAYLGVKLASKSPEAAKDLASAVSGGLSDDIIDGVKEKAQAAGRWFMGDQSRKRRWGESYVASLFDSNFLVEAFMEETEIDEIFMEIYGAGSVVNEADKEGGEEKKIGLEDILKSKKFQAKIENSPRAKEMKAAAEEAIQKQAAEMFAIVEPTLKAKSLPELLKVTGAAKKMGPEEKSALQQTEKTTAELPGVGEQKSDDQMLKMAKQAAIKSLEGAIKAKIKGIPKGPYTAAFTAVLEKAKGMAK